MRISDWSSDVCSSDLKMQLENTGVGTGQADEPPEKAEPPPTSWVRLLPLRTMGVSANDLDPYLRYFWLVFLALALAVGFGMLAVGLDVLSRLRSDARRVGQECDSTCISRGSPC